MKPLIFLDFKQSQDGLSVIIRKDKLGQMFDEIYQAGYNDGLERGKNIITTPFRIVDTTPDVDKNWWNNPTVKCDGYEASKKEICGIDVGGQIGGWTIVRDNVGTNDSKE